MATFADRLVNPKKFLIGSSRTLIEKSFGLPAFSHPCSTAFAMDEASWMTDFILLPSVLFFVSLLKKS